ncbi:Acetamidase regulatory protein [Talaromyces islandicus]|uniref:Acetamidase regulatory protein n=1 Tax=Talaromyces islandicus TaxID=28573 RepID=A0A0U1M6L0_TALIS|nr:Acetamidase regulatory protein [Talaromyces islandicus]
MDNRSPAGAFRRRLNTSCYMCKKRKVRCDAAADEPCSACKRAGIECRNHLNQQRPTLDRQRRGSPKDNTVSEDKDNDKERDTDRDNRARTLSRFFEAGILSSNWNGFEENGTFRNVYIGTDISNLHHLVRGHEPPGNNFLCYPFPAIRDELPWKPHPEIKGHHYLTPESANDLSSLPVRSVRDALVATYFDDIHPGFPVIDEAEFRRRYADPQNPPPLLILQAVLLAAARISTHPQVAASRARTTATLYRRAKTLFDLRHESDRVDLIQAALLLAWYTENSDTVSSNAYFWTGNATRIAFGMALHRRASLRYVPPQRVRYYRKYKKIWWMLVYSEVMLSLEYGRPCMIRAGDFDVGALEEEDFKNMDDTDDELVDHGFCLGLADLSLVALDVASPGGNNKIELIEHRLAQAAIRIRPSHDVWSCQLRLVYNLIVLVVYRCNNTLTDRAGKLCSEAASNILTTFETMLSQNTIRQCHLSSTTALMAAAIQFAREVRSATTQQHVVSAISAQAQLERLLAAAEALAGVFAHVEAVCRLCKSLNACAERVIRETQARARHFASEEEGLVGSALSAGIDWEDIMTNYRMQHGGGFGFGVGGEEWLSEYPV